ncbi:MAG: hypothetical protein ACI85I_001984 [Arenicella sp.]
MKFESKIRVEWYYLEKYYKDDYDEDMYNAGLELKSQVNLEFKLISY